MQEEKFHLVPVTFTRNPDYSPPDYFSGLQDTAAMRLNRHG